MTIKKDFIEPANDPEEAIKKNYLDMIEADKPDLWNRIEEKITFMEQSQTTIPVTDNDKPEKRAKKNEKLFSFFNSIQHFVFGGSSMKTAALLCCCCFIIMGVFGIPSMTHKNFTPNDIDTFYGNGSLDVLYSKSESGALYNMVELEENAAIDMDFADAGPSSDAASSSHDTDIDVRNSSRKMIRTIDLTVQTLNFEDLLSSIQEQVKAVGGYIESSSVEGSSYFDTQTRYAYLTLRIPQEETEDFLNALSGEATITHKNENLEDITLTYVDVESHIKALKTEEETLLEILKKAENLEDILAIHSELSSLRYQIDSYQSQLKTYDNQVAYDTLTLSVNEVKKIEPAKEPGFFERITNSFIGGIEGSIYFMQNLIIFFAEALPYLIIFFVMILLISRIIKKMRKKHK